MNWSGWLSNYSLGSNELGFDAMVVIDSPEAHWPRGC